MLKFLFAFVFFQVGIQASTLGTLVYSSLGTTSLNGPAFVAMIQAVANCVALLIPQNFLSKLSIKKALVSTLLVCSANYIFANLTGNIQPIIFFLRIFMGAIGTSLLLSNGPRMAFEEPKKGNQLLQSGAALAALLGYSSAPMIATSIQNIFAVDTIINLIATMAIMSYNKPLSIEESAPKKNTNITVENIVSDKNIRTALILTFILWCFGGFFYVIEVPLLVNKFSFSKLEISKIFLATISFNLLTTAFANRKTIDKFDNIAMILSVMVVGIACINYATTENVIFLVCSVLTIGVFNGIFNLSQSNILQKITQTEVRLQGYLAARMFSQLGLMAGALIAGVSISTSDFKKQNYSYTNEAVPTTIKIKLRAIPSNIEPYNNSDASSMFVIHQVFENLFEYDDKNALIPNLVKNILWKEKNKILELKIKDDIQLSNGEFLTSVDVKNSLLEAKESMGSSGNWAFGFIKEIKIKNEKTLELIFSKPMALMPAILASPYFGIFKRLNNGTIIGTANYKIEKKTPDSIVLKNWKTIAFEQKIIFSQKYQPTEDVLISDTPIDGLTKLEIPTLQTILLVPNFRDPSLKNRNIRCALIKEFTKVAPQIYSKWNPVELGMPFSKNFFSDSNIEIYRKPEIISKINIIYADSAAKFDQNLNSEIAQKLNKIQLNVDFQNVSIEKLIQKAKSGKFSVLLFGYVPDFIHPHALISPLLGQNQIYNFGRYENPKVEKLLDTALSEPIKTNQNSLYAKALSEIYNDCAIAFLGSQNSNLYLSPKLKHVVVGQLGIHNFNLSTVRIKDDKY